MRFATWNLSHAVKRGWEQRAEAWRHLAGLGFDIAMVQEAAQPITDVKASIVAADPQQRDWGTAVVSYGPSLLELDQPLRPWWNSSLEFRVPDIARDGTLAVAMLDVLDPPVVVVSLYGMLRYADQSVLRAACDLMPIFDTRLGKHVVVAGDFNIHTHSNDAAERRRAGPILDLLESFGLRNLVRHAKREGILRQGDQEYLEHPCPCGLPDCSHVRTHRHPRSKKGAMANNDYILATEDLARRLQSLEVMNGDADAAWLHSDHAPIVADFEL